MTADQIEVLVCLIVLFVGGFGIMGFSLYSLWRIEQGYIERGLLADKNGNFHAKGRKK